MLSFSRCKINLGLLVTGKRSDGFHNIDSVFYPVDVRDAIELIPSEKIQKGKCILTCRGIELDAAPGNNLCEKAFALLNKEFQLPGTEIYLQKNIPVGAGLGGGSGNAAKMLEMLNDLYQLKISKSNLVHYAMQLGSDCGFFIHDTACYVTGRGENIQSIDFSLKGFTLVLIHPGIHVSTAEAYAGIIPISGRKTTQEIVQKTPIIEWRHILSNDFEKTIFNNRPEIEKIKSDLYSHGAVYAAMSGSGSSVYGIFKSGAGELQSLKPVFDRYRIFITSLH